MGCLPFNPERTLTGMSTDDLGRRIAAARGYRAMSIQSLADSVGITVPILERFEAGLEDLSEGNGWALLQAVATATRLPVQFFTTDFETLPNTGPPEERLGALEAKADETLTVINEALARMNEVSREADAQMTRGKEQLDRFIATQRHDRALLRLIAEHCGVPPEDLSPFGPPDDA